VIVVSPELAVDIGQCSAGSAALKSEVAVLKAEAAKGKAVVARANPGAAARALAGLPRPLGTGAVKPGVVVPTPMPANVAIEARTLLATNAQALRSLQIELRAAELLLEKGAGKWPFEEFQGFVAGRAPVLVLVEAACGVCGGFATIPFAAGEGRGWDPTCTTFVFSLSPTAARCPLKKKTEALHLGRSGFMFGWHEGTGA
jgi:hypothetical protein